MVARAGLVGLSRKAFNWRCVTAHGLKKCEVLDRGRRDLPLRPLAHWFGGVRESSLRLT